MKYVVATFSLVAIIVALFIFGTFPNQNEEYLRIHIRANSNVEADQAVKYEIRDKVVDVLIPILADCKTKAEAEEAMQSNLLFIEKTADTILLSHGFNYTSKAKLANEQFPTRSYESLTLEGGFYDALIIELGEATGDNWWCVVYPPFCFLQTGNPNNIKYTSVLYEIISDWIN